ncbi:hypothetical protein ACFWBX_38600 [Streptomyces sp. NPDC059991]|uniref:hypothetical protein n=1 Tax=Streptomyces sp. NPDC059991 TaxID=3347028 RepID=UPI0036AFD24E
MTATAVCPASSATKKSTLVRASSTWRQSLSGAAPVSSFDRSWVSRQYRFCPYSSKRRIALPSRVGAICAGSTGNRLSRSWSSPRCAEVRRRSLRTARARRGSLRTRTRSAAASGPSTVPSRARRSRPSSCVRSASALRAARARRHPAS